MGAVNTRRLFAVAALSLSAAAALIACGAAYVVITRPRFRTLGPTRALKTISAYFLDSRAREFVNALNEAEPSNDTFPMMLDVNQEVFLSRRLFSEIDMDGVHKYAYKPNLRKLGFVARARELEWRLEVEDTPRLRKALAGVQTLVVMHASYDEHGFRRVASSPAACSRRVLFLGDSFTDGLWVNDEDTFASRYGAIVQQRVSPSICAVNAGVNGYDSFEERFVLEHNFDAAGRPSLVFVMYFPNDVDNDYWSVVNGTLRDQDRLWGESLRELHRMQRFAVKQGSTLVLVAIPPVEQIQRRQTRKYYQDRLRAFAAEERVLFLDPYDELSRGDPRLMYWTWDPHLTPAGHEVMAAFLYEQTKALLQ